MQKTTWISGTGGDQPLRCEKEKSGEELVVVIKSRCKYEAEQD